MDNNFKLGLLIILATFSLAFSKVPHRIGGIQHPAVLTRPPTQPSTTKSGKATGNKRNKPTTAEYDDDLFTTTPSSYGSNWRQGGFHYGGNTADSFYDYATFTASGPAAGGTSWEYDDDLITTQLPTGFGSNRRHNGNNRRLPGYGVRTTPQPTTTPEPPEVEEERPTGNSLFGTSSGMSARGLCFCSPLQTCPTQSVPRRGLCKNFLSLFTRIRFIRCCYRPSLAKRLDLRNT